MPTIRSSPALGDSPSGTCSRSPSRRDSGLGVIYRVSAGQTTAPWGKNDSTSDVNGLVARGNRLIAITMGFESPVFIDLETGEVESLIDMRPFGGDGITVDVAGAFLVSDFNGTLLRVTPSGNRDVLIDTREVGVSLTDFAFAPDLGLLVAPTLRGNSVLAFDMSAN